MMDAWTNLDVLFIGVLVLIALAFLIPLIYGIVKKKYWLLIAECVVVLCIILCCYLCPTRFPYMDPWIMGKTRDQIVALYGEPTGYDSDGMIAYDLGPDRGFFGIMSDAHHWYYYIHFDSNGRAYKVLDGGPIGG